MKKEHKNTPYVVSEWQWLQVQLKLYQLEYSAEYFSTIFEFPENGKIECAFFAKQIQDMVENNASKEEQLKYYEDWADYAQRIILEKIEELPVLSKEFDIMNDLVVSIRHDYGMGSSSICEFHGNQIIWPLEKYQK